MGNVVLIGYRGSGKTTVGRLLAGRLACAFIDTDALIVERAGKSIAEIFAGDGEPVFRSLEADIIAEVASRSKIVLSAGGGAVLRAQNVEHLRACGTVFWLTADARTLWSRISGDAATAANRPALTEHDGLAEVEHLLREREPHYSACAHHRIDVGGGTAGEAAEEIRVIVERERNCES
ncbi:MAG: shikimate kinase [bacterium]|nr:shikimate kinase [bacterium]